uniref:Innexin n=1 Tax=Bursaphelenchus xylophilus TaxID=6326 RepID=A0A1I7RNI8_BURXY
MNKWTEKRFDNLLFNVGLVLRLVFAKKNRKWIRCVMCLTILGFLYRTWVYFVMKRDVERYFIINSEPYRDDYCVIYDYWPVDSIYNETVTLTLHATLPFVEYLEEHSRSPPRCTVHPGAPFAQVHSSKCVRCTVRSGAPFSQVHCLFQVHCSDTTEN